MILSDKQALRKCVKQVVRHTGIVDVVSFDPFTTGIGIDPMLGTFPGGHNLGKEPALTPIYDGAAALYAAMDAMGIALSNMEEAEAQQKSYTREGWLREILDVMPARCVLVETPMNAQTVPSDADYRFVPLLKVDADQVKRDRYGMHLEQEAERIFESCIRFGTRQILLSAFDEYFLQYCLFPLTEDRDLILHARLDSAKEIDRFMRLARQFPASHCVMYTTSEAEPALIRAVYGRERLLAAVRTPEYVDLALGVLGFHFLPQASFALYPEQMLGNWIVNRERLHETISERYLPLARAGYEITSEAIEADITKLFSDGFIRYAGIENL